MAGRLFYIFFGAAMLLAIGLGKIEDESLNQTLLPFFPLLLGLSMICLSQQAVVDGRIFGRRRPLWKNRHLILFWSSVSFYFLCGVILFIAGIWQWL